MTTPLNTVRRELCTERTDSNGLKWFRYDLVMTINNGIGTVYIYIKAKTY